MSIYMENQEPNYLNESGANKSFASSFSSVNTTSSSKAVLAALKALQDKIRRLETERSQALDEITTLKLQLKNQEIEYENARQKEILHNQRQIQENKLSYDHLAQEKNDLEQKLSKILDKNSSISELSNNLQMKIQMLEEEKNSLIQKSKDLESENSQLELQIKQSQLHEKDLAHALATETKRNSDELLSLQTQLMNLQHQHQYMLIEKDSQQQKLSELDLLIEQLLTLNESLISQLSGKPFKFHSKASKSRGISANVPSIESIANEASKILLKSLEKKGAAGSARASAVSKNIETIEHMKLMHKIYSDIARKMTKLSSRKKSPSKVSRKSEEGDRGYESTASTRVKMRKRDLQQSQSFLSSASTPAKERKMKSALKRSNSNFTNVTALTGDFTVSPVSEVKRREVRMPRVQSTPGDSEDYLLAGHDSASPEAMNSVIAQLEEEFNSLNSKYRSLLSNVSASNPATSFLQPPSDTNDNNNSSSQHIQSQAEEIVQVIQKLHEKGEQIRLLKSPSKI